TPSSFLVFLFLFVFFISSILFFILIFILIAVSSLPILLGYFFTLINAILSSGGWAALRSIGCQSRLLLAHKISRLHQFLTLSTLNSFLLILRFFRNLQKHFLQRRQTQLQVTHTQRL